jgi:phage terminase large subunit-like protein
VSLVQRLTVAAKHGPAVAVTGGKTIDNRGNLAAGFIARVREAYGGTRLTTTSFGSSARAASISAAATVSARAAASCTTFANNFSIIVPPR